MKSFSTWKRATVFGALVVLNAALVTAQDHSERRTRGMDIFELFSAAHDHAPNASTDVGAANPAWLYGFNGGFSTNIHRSLDIVMEVTGLGAGRDVLPGASADSTATGQYAQTALLLVGPQFTMRRHRLLEPFARGLVGYSHRDVTPQEVNTGFAAGLGGGLDLVLSPLLAMRIIQYDFLAHTGPNGWTRCQRVSFGVVLRLRFGSDPAEPR